MISLKIQHYSQWEKMVFLTWEALESVKSWAKGVDCRDHIYQGAWSYPQQKNQKTIYARGMQAQKIYIRIQHYSQWEKEALESVESWAKGDCRDYFSSCNIYTCSRQFFMQLSSTCICHDTYIPRCENLYHCAQWARCCSLTLKEEHGMKYELRRIAWIIYTCSRLLSSTCICHDTHIYIHRYENLYHCAQCARCCSLTLYILTMYSNPSVIAQCWLQQLGIYSLHAGEVGGYRATH